ncbi:Ribosomal oxygenase 1 [Coccomyxa sp. Obi]|nr:Ribosomal oxygenase 1 [Coccomyxa sp. Obi]
MGKKRGGQLGDPNGKQKKLKTGVLPAKELDSGDYVELADSRTAAEVQDTAACSGREVLQHILGPCKTSFFFKSVWEKRVLLVRRQECPKLFESWCSKEALKDLLQREDLSYTYNVDVTKYDGQERENYNYNQSKNASEDIADPDVVWARYSQDGCSVRLLHPQRWFEHLADTLAKLEEVFSSCVGCNAYLTPANSKGFAPHFDDIDAFVLQVEGAKRWRLHKPITEDHVLPRFSSPDFSQEDLDEPFLDIVLQPGDLLYMPRGTIHQAQALPEAHSLHLTVSANQRNSWADFLEVALPRALQLAAEECVDLRRAMPLGYMQYMGVQYSDSSDLEAKRAAFESTAQAMVQRVLEFLPLDGAADQLAAQFLQQRLPPSRNPEAAAQPSLAWGSRVLLRKPDVARLVVEGDAAVVYHCLANERQCHASIADDERSSSAGRLEFSLDRAPALEALLLRTPSVGKGVALCKVLPCRDADDLLAARQLQKEGILINSKEPSLTLQSE